MTAPGDLLDDVLGPCPPPFAILHRPGAGGAGEVDILAGAVSHPDRLADIPAGTGDVLVLVPYRQIAERGLDGNDDGAPLVALGVERRTTLPLDELTARLPDRVTRIEDGRFEPSDREYAAAVQRVIDGEIGRGEGSNLVLKRSYVGRLPEYSVTSALAAFRRLLGSEAGTYWTFVVHCGDRTFVGASPERHITLDDGLVTMNPISGTYRYPPGGPSLDDVMDFLDDGKEIDELNMVLDEELKMMTRICPGGARVVGPYFREMARLAHTEYLIAGRSGLDPRDILRETMFAPTVTGSPLESAARMIRRHEHGGRGYYSGVAALLGQDDDGTPRMDSAILIRTAEIDRAGRVEIGVGSTVVRHSDPFSEVAETRAKADALLSVLEPPRTGFADHPDVHAALAARSRHLAGFWLGGTDGAGGTDLPRDGFPGLAGLRVLVVDAEDSFTAMLGHQLRSLDVRMTIERFDEADPPAGHDLVVMGPGPGNPVDDDDPKIARLGVMIDDLLAAGVPLLAVCLSHQVLCRRLGLPLHCLEQPNQGLQREIDLFGAAETVGFYNTFTARSGSDTFRHPDLGLVHISRDRESGDVHALRGDGFASLQFHPESVLTLRGIRIVADAFAGLVPRAAAVSP